MDDRQCAGTASSRTQSRSLATRICPVPSQLRPDLTSFQPLQRILPSVKGNNKARSGERALFALFARIQSANGILSENITRNLFHGLENAAGRNGRKHLAVNNHSRQGPDAKELADLLGLIQVYVARIVTVLAHGQLLGSVHRGP